MHRTTGSLITIMLTVGCAAPDPGSAPDPAVWTPETAWRLSEQPVVEIRGDAQRIEGKPLDPVSVFPLKDGRYVVADGNQNGWQALMVYDQRGQFIEKWGGKGEGPGEFIQLYVWAGPYRGDSIAAFDSKPKIEIFAPDGKPARTIPFPEGGACCLMGNLPNGNFIRFVSVAVRSRRDLEEAERKRERAVGIHDPDGRLIREIARLPLPPRTENPGLPNMRRYFGPPVLVSHAGRTHWYWGRGEDFSVNVVDSLGTITRVLRRPFTHERLTTADREEIITTLAKRSSGGVEGSPELASEYEKTLRKGSRWAEFRPAYGTIIEDADENVWVEHYRFIYPNFQAPKPKPTAWSVFDKTGRFLGEVPMPASFMVSSITTDQVLGFWQDEFDVEHVRIYKLIKP